MVEEKKSLIFGIISITYIYIIISIPVYDPIVVSCSPFVIPTPNDTAPNSCMGRGFRTLRFRSQVPSVILLRRVSYPITPVPNSVKIRLFVYIQTAVRGTALFLLSVMNTPSHSCLFWHAWWDAGAPVASVVCPCWISAA